MSLHLDKNELVRYSRHLLMSEFGLKDQLSLKASSVLVVGAGGLGAGVLPYLTAAGIGTIGIVDDDKVDLSNLQRQVIYNQNDVGEYKVDRASARLKELNENINFILYKERLSSHNAIRIIEAYDIVIDGTDNFPTRFLINDACVLLGKPNVHASIYQFEGQISVFNYKRSNEEYGPNYRDLFPEPPPPGLVPSCAEAGVLGILPGVFGMFQANETIKIITGIGRCLDGVLMKMDLLTMKTSYFKVKKTLENPLTGNNPTITSLIDYKEFCGFKIPNDNDQIDFKELKYLMDIGDLFVLIDVRERVEYEIFNIGGTNIPLGEIENNLNKIPIKGKVILHCKTGNRSAKAIHLLQEKYNYQNLINLVGEIELWNRKD
jgi:molybdopterin/thiamine biosynthesis adenylyltransferase/rhodanese-related sulfurtransferase